MGVMDGAQRGIVLLRTFDTRFAQSKEANIRAQVYAPTLRCRHNTTPRRALQC